MAKRKRQGKRGVAVKEFWKSKTNELLAVLKNVAEAGAQSCEVAADGTRTDIDYAAASVEEILNHEKSALVELPIWVWMRLGIGSLSAVVYPMEHREYARAYVEKPEAARTEPIYENTFYAKAMEVAWTTTHQWTSTVDAADGLCRVMAVDFQIISPHELGVHALAILTRLGSLLATVPEASLHWRPDFLPNEAPLTSLAPEVLAAWWLSTRGIMIEGGDASATGHWLVQSPIFETPVLLTETWPNCNSFKQLVSRCRQSGTTEPTGLSGLTSPGYRVVESSLGQLLLRNRFGDHSHPAEKMRPWSIQIPWCACSSGTNVVQSSHERLSQLLFGPVRSLPKDLYGKTKVGKLAGVSTATVYRWLKLGVIEPHGPRGEISLSELQAVIKSHPNRSLPDAISGL